MMTIKAEQFYTDIAEHHNLRSPQMFQGAQYAMGEPGLRLSIYRIGDADFGERAQSVTADYQVALDRICAFTVALARKKLPKTPLVSDGRLASSRTVAIRGLVRSLVPERHNGTGYLKDFRIETVDPAEIGPGVLGGFRRSEKERANRGVPDAAAYLLNTALMVIGRETARVGAVTKVEPQAKMNADDSFAGLYEQPTCLTLKLGVNSELLDPALFEVPAALRISAARAF